jgi:hypothetical protein
MGFLALVCIIIGLVVGLFDAEVAMPAMQWFVCGIAFALLAGSSPWTIPGVTRTKQ